MLESEKYNFRTTCWKPDQSIGNWFSEVLDDLYATAAQISYFNIDIKNQTKEIKREWFSQQTRIPKRKVEALSLSKSRYFAREEFREHLARSITTLAESINNQLSYSSHKLPSERLGHYGFPNSYKNKISLGSWAMRRLEILYSAAPENQNENNPNTQNLHSKIIWLSKKSGIDTDKLEKLIKNSELRFDLKLLSRIAIKNSSGGIIIFGEYDPPFNLEKEISSNKLYTGDTHYLSTCIDISTHYDCVFNKLIRQVGKCIFCDKKTEIYQFYASNFCNRQYGAISEIKQTGSFEIEIATCEEHLKPVKAALTRPLSDAVSNTLNKHRINQQTLSKEIHDVKQSSLSRLLNSEFNSADPIVTLQIYQILIREKINQDLVLNVRDLYNFSAKHIIQQTEIGFYPHDIMHPLNIYGKIDEFDIHNPYIDSYLILDEIFQEFIDVRQDLKDCNSREIRSIKLYDYDLNDFSITKTQIALVFKLQIHISYENNYPKFEDAGENFEMHLKVIIADLNSHMTFDVKRMIFNRNANNSMNNERVNNKDTLYNTFRII